MFNKSIYTLKKISLALACFVMLFACNEDVTLSFTDQTVEKTESAIVTITYPKADGTKAIADQINKSIENFLANEINMSEKRNNDLTLNEAIAGFEKEYAIFKEDFSDSTQEWEALIESEVNYESDQIISIAVNSYLDTGGAHGNSHVSFLNFDKKTGKRLMQSDIIKDRNGLKKLAQPYLEKMTKPLSNDEEVQDLFFGEDFQLPETIGFNDEGVIMLYNVYEIASYAQGITEFTIPYSEAQPFLNISLE